MNTQLATAFRHPCFHAEECLRPEITARRHGMMSTKVTVNVGLE